MRLWFFLPRQSWTLAQEKEMSEVWKEVTMTRFEQFKLRHAAVPVGIATVQRVMFSLVDPKNKRLETPEEQKRLEEIKNICQATYSEHFASKRTYEDFATYIGFHLAQLGKLIVKLEKE